MPPIRLLAAAAAVSCALAGAGCTTGPDYRRPAVDLPPAWLPPAAPAASSAAGAASERLARADAALAAPAPAQGGPELLDTAWWQALGDPRLDELIRIAVAENKDLRIAAARVQQFDAYLQIAKAAGGPQASVAASRLRNSLSENRQVPLAAGTPPVDNDYAVGVQASWELDLWGKIGRAQEAAYAELVASEENRRALVQSLVSEVASGYVRLLAVDRQIELQQQAVALQRETLRLAEAKYRGGGSAELPVIRAQADLQHLQADLPAREAERAALENALSGLLGRNPGPIARGRTVAQLQLPRVPGGLPADLLAQRPDIRKAEQDLISANAKIGVAKAQYLPSIALTGSSGFASDDLSRLAMLSSNFGNFGVALLGPLFTSGRIAGQVREAEAVRQQAEIGFLRAAQTALREVDDALTLHAKTTQQVAIRALEVDALREQRDLAKKRYDGGYSGYADVLDAERQLVAGQQGESLARRDQFTSLIAIYKAMGGGWSLPELNAARPTAEKTAHD